MLQLIAAKFPPKEHLIRFHLCYLVANSSDSQHYTSQRPVMFYPVEKKWLSLEVSAAFHMNPLY